MNAPRAREQQIDSDERDTRLTALACEGRPTVQHWWGRRTHQGRHGAFCYICNDIVATWSSRWPITERAKYKLHAHRAIHIRELLDGSHLKPEERS